MLKGFTEKNQRVLK